MPQEEFKRKLAAVLSADVKAYSRLMRDDEAATIRTLTEYREAIGALVSQHHGRVVDTVGDNLLAEFGSVVDAVRAAAAIQQELKARNATLPESRKMLFRIGINLGDVVVEGDRIYGDGLNIAARLEALAPPGGICISRTAYDQIEDKLPFGYEYLGEKNAKNMARPLRVYRVLFDPEEQTPDSAKTEDPSAQKGHEQTVSVQQERPAAQTPGHIPSERGIRGSRQLFRHVFMYAGVAGFSFLINMLTWNGVLWFHWPPLGWGFLHFLHWVRGSRHTPKNRPAA